MVTSHHICSKSHEGKAQVIIRDLYQPWRVGQSQGGVLEEVTAMLRWKPPGLVGGAGRHLWLRNQPVPMRGNGIEGGTVLCL